jgi:hypothetical protein
MHFPLISTKENTAPKDGIFEEYMSHGFNRLVCLFDYRKTKRKDKHKGHQQGDYRFYIFVQHIYSSSIFDCFCFY